MVSNFKFIDLAARVYPPDPPLVNGQPPVVEQPEPDAPAGPPKFLLLVGIGICLYVIGALVAIFVRALRANSAPETWAEMCLGIVAALGLAAIGGLGVAIVGARHEH